MSQIKSSTPVTNETKSPTSASNESTQNAELELVDTVNTKNGLISTIIIIVLFFLALLSYFIKKRNNTDSGFTLFKTTLSKKYSIAKWTTWISIIFVVFSIIFMITSALTGTKGIDFNVQDEVKSILGF